MGGTLMLKFGKGEIAKVKKVFHGISPDGQNLYAPDCKELPEISKQRGLFVEFNKSIMTMDYAIWDHYSSTWGMIFAQELGKKFNIIKAGWDSIGWVDDVYEFLEYHIIPKGVKSRLMWALVLYGLTAKRADALEKRWRNEAKRLIEESLEVKL